VGEKASVFKAQIPLGQQAVDMTGIWDEGHAHYPGRSVYLTHKGLGKLRGGPKNKQKSAEPILASVEVKGGTYKSNGYIFFAMGKGSSH